MDTTIDGQCNPNILIGHNQPPMPAELGTVYDHRLAMLAALRVADISKRARAFGLGLCMFMDESGFCNPGMRTLAGLLPISKNSIAQCILELTDAGLMSVTRRGIRVSNQYQSQITKERAIELFTTKEKAKRKTPVSLARTDLTPRVPLERTEAKIPQIELCPSREDTEPLHLQDHCPPRGNGRSRLDSRDSSNRENQKNHSSQQARSRRVKITEVEESFVSREEFGSHPFENTNNAHNNFESEQMDLETAALAKEFDELFATVPVENRLIMMNDFRTWLGSDINEAFRQVLFVARDVSAGNVVVAFRLARTAKLKSINPISRFKFFQTVAYDNHRQHGMVALNAGGRAQITRGQAL